MDIVYPLRLNVSSTKRKNVVDESSHFILACIFHFDFFYFLKKSANSARANEMFDNAIDFTVLLLVYRLLSRYMCECLVHHLLRAVVAATI